MDKPLIAGLLTAWCLLVVAPALLVSLLFPDTSTGTDIGGSVVIIWIVGYLVQIGVFMIAAREVKSNAIGGWFLASSMPFIADWSVPIAPWSPIAIVAVVGAYSTWLYSRVERRDKLQHNGIPATGTVLEVKKPIMNVVMNNVYVRRTLMLRVQRSDGTPPYQVKRSGMFMLGEILSPGDVFNLRVDPKNPKHIETIDSASEAAPQDAPPPGDSTIADQLQQLDDMHKRGALTDDEFAAAKRRLLRG